MDLCVPLGSSLSVAGSECCTFIPVCGHLKRMGRDIRDSVVPPCGNENYVSLRRCFRKAAVPGVDRVGNTRANSNLCSGLFPIGDLERKFCWSYCPVFASPRTKLSGGGSSPACSLRSAAISTSRAATSGSDVVFAILSSAAAARRAW
jgi:hypothetical protein